MGIAIGCHVGFFNLQVIMPILVIAINSPELALPLSPYPIPFQHDIRTSCHLFFKSITGGLFYQIGFTVNRQHDRCRRFGNLQCFQPAFVIRFNRPSKTKIVGQWRYSTIQHLRLISAYMIDREYFFLYSLKKFVFFRETIVRHFLALTTKHSEVNRHRGTEY